MHISELVPLLASEVMQSDLRLSDAQIRSLDVLAELPQYVQRDRLGEWDQDVRAELDDVGLDPRATEIVNSIWELCQGIVYGGFDSIRAESAYGSVADSFRRAGLRPPEIGVIDGE